MKNPPTLADACIATALDKRRGGLKGSEEIRDLLLTVGRANKFILDAGMSGYLADLSNSFWTGGLRKRIHQLDNARRLARLPHKLTWIEYDRLAYFKRVEALGIKIAWPSGTPDWDKKAPRRHGWLIRQHPNIETAFFLSNIYSSV